MIWVVAEWHGLLNSCLLRWRFWFSFCFRHKYIRNSSSQAVWHEFVSWQLWPWMSNIWLDVYLQFSHTFFSFWTLFCHGWALAEESFRLDQIIISHSVVLCGKHIAPFGTNNHKLVLIRPNVYSNFDIFLLPYPSLFISPGERFLLYCIWTFAYSSVSLSGFCID